MDRLEQQINFLVEADKLKSVERRTRLIDDSRHENSAEHSWHLLLAAVILREYATADIDVLRVMELISMHDLVEIDAGDTFAYDRAGQTTKAEREHAAAERIFGLLPEDQQSYFHTLWHEFEAQQTPEARFANALDRFQPLLLNAHSEGGSWKQLLLTRDDVLRRMAPIESAMPDLWPTVIRVVDAFCVAGVLKLSR
jgi:putative hydrolase of HD superfamily